MSQQGKVFKQRYYRKLNTLSILGQYYYQVASNLNMPQKGKIFKKRYYRNINTLSFSRPVLL